MRDDECEMAVQSGVIDTTPEDWPNFAQFNEHWFDRFFVGQPYVAFFGRVGLGAPLVAVLKDELVVRRCLARFLFPWFITS